MEFRMWNLVKRKLPIILLASVMAATVALVGAKQVKPSYETHFSYVVSLSEREAAPEYRFDGYYALQATDLFSATLARWLLAPETVVAAYTEAGLPLPSDDPRQIERAVIAEKTSAQLVAVTVQGPTSDTAERLARGLQEAMGKNIETYHDQGVPAARFTAVATAPWTGVTRLSVPVVVGATFGFTFLIFLNAVLFIESLKKTDADRD